jgi:hypothetical protein
MWIPLANNVIVPTGLHWRCRQQGRYGQFEKPAPAFVDAGVGRE